VKSIHSSATARWRVFSASATGKSHLDVGLPCQDASAHAVIGETLVAAVCDGAGSASRSDLGARECAQAIVELIRQHLAGIGEAAPLHELVEHLPELVAQARKRLFDLAGRLGLPVDELGCTLLGVLARPGGGVFFHLGDGLGIAEGEEPVDTVVSPPENGEYANETWFITAESWARHLRTSPFAGRAPRCIGLMSDGAMPFVMGKGQRSYFEPFMAPVRAFLVTADEAEGSEALMEVLGDARTHAITADDKTLLLATFR